MSRIDELIQELAPTGVRHVVLSDVAEYSPTRIDAADLDEANFVGVDNLVADKGGRIDASYPPNTARLTAYESGDILLGNIRPYLKKVWRATNEGGCSGDVLAIRIKGGNHVGLDSKFLYYLLSSDGFFAYNMQHAKGAKMPRGSKAAILNYRIPVPPVEVQREIVRVLDKFTQLEAELEAELEARRAQYEHYRGQALRFVEAATSVPVGDVITRVSSGRNKSRSETGAFPVYGSTGKIGTTDAFAYSGPALLIARVGANAGRVNMVDGKYDVSDNTLIVTPTDRWDIGFAYYQLTHMHLNQYAVGGGQPLVTGRLIKGLTIALPDLSEQRRIAGVLDRFDTLINDISIGLPAELAARRQQYEHYRDRLLSFEELTV